MADILKRKANIADLCDELRRNYKAQTKGRRADDRELFAAVCRIALQLKHNSDDYFDFCRLPAWDSNGKHRPKNTDRNNPIAAVLKLVRGFDTRHKLQWVNLRAHALSHFIEENTPPENIPSEIKRRGGIVAMAKARKASNTSGKIGPFVRVKNAIPEANMVQYFKILSKQPKGTKTWIDVKCEESPDGNLVVKLLDIASY